VVNGAGDGRRDSGYGMLADAFDAEDIERFSS
jgi:hypothetical protein